MYCKCTTNDRKYNNYKTVVSSSIEMKLLEQNRSFLNHSFIHLKITGKQFKKIHKMLSALEKQKNGFIVVLFFCVNTNEGRQSVTRTCDRGAHQGTQLIKT